MDPVSSPPWKAYKHRPTSVRAFRWEREMGECIPQIQMIGNSFVLTTDWNVDVPLKDGDWIVQTPKDEVWVVSHDKFDHWYERV